MAMIQRAARTIAPPERDGFLRAVAARLGSQPGDVAVESAVRAALPPSIKQLGPLMR